MKGSGINDDGNGKTAEAAVRAEIKRQRRKKKRTKTKYQSVTIN
jgi:hypothetical protein